MLKLKRYLQFFAEGDPAVETAPATPPAAPTPTGKTFSEDYVQTLREEAKQRRLSEKNLAAKLRAVMGLKEDEEVDDAKITAYQTKHQSELTAAMQKANERLLQAEIKSLEGVDAKLVSRLLDKSKVKIAEDGTVTGLKEAVDELAKEFPAVLKAASTTSPANPPGAGGVSLQDEYNQAYKDAQANPRNEELKKKVFLLKERLRG